MEHPAYTFKRRVFVAEIDAEAFEYEHEKTGAQILSLVCEDDNKTFGVTFRTPPEDSTGIAHILEHSVLGGSHKYPVKEPFKELLKSSVNTFLNAMTYSDKTVYPVASQNLKDYYNLVDVYLDAVFFPTLHRHTFEQEGWHVELETPESSPIYKGVVFNEMKGVYSSPDETAGRLIERYLLPESTYGHDSGGDPAAITDLTFEQFSEFHQRLYHPSNARIWFYGDDDPTERLDRLDAVLSQFEARDPRSAIVRQTPWTEPRKASDRYIAGPDSLEKPSSFAVQSWMLGDSDNREERALLSLLNYLLTGKPGSPLRRALVESGLGGDLAGYGFYAGMEHMIFSTGLKGVDAGDTAAVFALIQKTLEDVANQGFSEKQIEAAMNISEFRLRENNTGRTPRGMVYMLRAMSDWLYGRDPLVPLQYEPLLKAVKERIASEPNVFGNLLRKYILDNPHRLDLEVHPDPDLQDELEKAEQDCLDQLEAELTAEDRVALAENTQKLLALQETPDSPESLATIPQLALSDVGTTVKPVLREVEKGEGIEFLSHDHNTEGIYYLRLAFDIKTVPVEWVPYIPLFGRTLKEMGTASYDFTEITEEIDRRTGGIGDSTYTGNYRWSEQFQARQIIGGKVMADRADGLFELLEEMLLRPDFSDKERFRQMALEEKAGEESSLIPGGHSVVRTRLMARCNASNWFDEQIDGVTYLFWLRELIERIDRDWDEIEHILRSMHELVYQRNGCTVSTVVDAKTEAKLRPRLDAFLDKLPKHDAPIQTWSTGEYPANEALLLPAQVNYVGQLLDLNSVGYEHHGSIHVISRYLRTGYLWDQVRVMGGAYGAMCNYDRVSNTMGFLSYRDPNVKQSLDAYAGTADFLRNADLSDSLIGQAIIGMTGDLDQPKLPPAKAHASFTWYLCGITDEDRQQVRDEILSTRKEHFLMLADALEGAAPTAEMCVLGNEEKIRGDLDAVLGDDLVFTYLNA